MSMTAIGADGTRLFEMSPALVARLNASIADGQISEKTTILPLGRTSAMVRFASDEDVVLAKIRLA